MGLDLSFNRKAALAAGATIIESTRGMPEEIAAARARGDHEDAAWLEEKCSLFQVPEMDWWVEDDGVDSIVIRANKWGRTYEPVTRFLRANNIPWSEF